MANGIAFLLATIFSYTINTLWSFSSLLHRRTLVRFGVVTILGGVLAMLISGLADIHGLHYAIGIALVATFVPPVTFLLHNSWTYK